MSIHDAETKPSFSQRLHDAYKRVEQGTAYFLLLAVTILEILKIPIAHELALSLLGVIILSQLFDLNRDKKAIKLSLSQISARVEELASAKPVFEQLSVTLEKLSTAIQPRRRFADVNEAESKIREYIEDCYKRDHNVEIKWIGMTMWNVGAVLAGLFNKLEHIEKLSCRVAMLDGEWLAANPINDEWNKDRAMQGKRNIEKIFLRQGPVKRQWDLKIYTYSHMPCVHGGLINDKYLFLGIAQWDEKQLHAGERPYFLYTAENADDREKIRIFNGWFSHCAKSGEATAKPAIVLESPTTHLGSQTSGDGQTPN